MPPHGDYLAADSVSRGIVLATADVKVDPVVLKKSAGTEKYSRVVIHYNRRDSNYVGWGLHIWGDVELPTSWENPMEATGEDDYGLFWIIPVAANGSSVEFLVHKGDTQDCRGVVNLQNGLTVWVVADRPTVFRERPDLASMPQGNLYLAKGFWVDATTLAWNVGEAGTQYALHSSMSASLTIGSSGIEGADESVPLTVDPSGLSAEAQEKFPHIKEYKALRLPSTIDVSKFVKGQLALSAVDESGDPLDATSVQIPGVLDNLFAYDGPLGASFSETGVTIHLWSPTAQSVNLNLYHGPHDNEPFEKLALQERNGVWSAEGPASWKGKYYLYEIANFYQSTGKLHTSLGVDPYSRGLAANGVKSFLVDLGHPSLKPDGWDDLEVDKPTLKALGDTSIYELHIRDFSASDPTVDPSIRGGYLAFSQPGTAGGEHLRSLAKAGMTHIHLLPCFDFGSVNEIKDSWKSVDSAYLATLPPDSEEQQAAVVAVQDSDAYNWGYDPVNWGVPDGSYATDPNGGLRTKEFRSMVQAINRMGFRVVLDVVYNHTHGSGPAGFGSVLDKIVPGYYLRRNTDGAVENSTCMNNTASEHLMMERIIIDDLLMWAREYKVDGFRFDLMGHIMLRTMLKAKKALQSLTLEKDGVDGSKIYMYGEGWDFGEIANNQRGVNACQVNLFGTGIGSFNDRIRDTAIGGSPFGHPQQQGFLTGLFLQPNALDQGDLKAQAQALASHTDWVRVGLTGSLRDYVIENAEGKKIKGGQLLTHDGAPVGYTASPLESVNYVSAHDNETLFDCILLKTARQLSLEERCRINHVATSLIALSQGVAFFHAGDDMLRSKSLDRDSYNSGDWFNKLDFMYESNNFGVGLPPKGKNGSKYNILRQLLADSSLKPKKKEIMAAMANLRELLTIRFSSPLFRLPSAKDVQDRLEFMNTGPSQVPGAIIMSIKDSTQSRGQLAQLDSRFRRVVAVFNVRPDDLSIEVPQLKGLNLELHPVLAGGHCDVVKASKFSSKSAVLEVPAYTTAVLVENR